MRFNLRYLLLSLQKTYYTASEHVFFLKHIIFLKHKHINIVKSSRRRRPAWNLWQCKTPHWKTRTPNAKHLTKKQNNLSKSVTWNGNSFNIRRTILYSDLVWNNPQRILQPSSQNKNFSKIRRTHMEVWNQRRFQTVEMRYFLEATLACSNRK